MLSVQTNLAANTALKNINTNSVNMNKSLERLSSGFRINNAADDAAGFAVSSKLDAQSSRLKAASLNASQAQAMVKMADAGVNEIQNMVGRIQSLAIQAASANNAGELSKLNAERVKLEGAIDKIATSTNFNGVNLLSGTSATALNSIAGTASGAATLAAGATDSAITGTNVATTGIFENAAFTITTSAPVAAVNNALATGASAPTKALTGTAANDIAVTMGTVGADAVDNGAYTFTTTTGTITGDTLTVLKAGVSVGTATLSAGAASSVTLAGGTILSFTAGTALANSTTAGTFTIDTGVTAAASQITGVVSDKNLVDASGVAVASSLAGANLLASPVTRTNAGTYTLNLNGAATITITDAATASQAQGTSTVTTTGATAGTAAVLAGGVLNRSYDFQVGADNTASNKVAVDLTKNYTSSGLGLGGAGNDLLTQANAQAYIDTAKAALDTIVTNRANLGATQNQVAFIQANLSTSIEQTSASVSSIRDADMAAEMANFTKNKILTQASTSMLAQANQVSQNVLSLFR